MATLTVRKLDDRLYELLRKRAQLHHRSIEGEVRALLAEQLASSADEQLIQEIDAFREAAGRRYTGDALAELRKERDEA